MPYLQLQQSLNLLILVPLWVTGSLDDDGHHASYQPLYDAPKIPTHCRGFEPEFMSAIESRIKSLVSAGQHHFETGSSLELTES
jgi:hypothetical protein